MPSGDEPSIGGQPAQISPALGGDHAILHLAEMLTHEDHQTAYTALEKLAEMGSDKALDRLIDFLYKTTDSLSSNVKHLYQSRIIKALGSWESNRALETLLSIYADPHLNLRRSIAGVLGKWIDDPRVIEPLFEVLGDDLGYYGSHEAAKALAASKDPVIQQRLIDGIDSENPSRRHGAVVGIRAFKLVSYIPRLKSIVLSDPNARVRTAAAYALVETAGEEAFDTLLAALADPDYHVRNHVIHQIAEVGGKRALQPLIAHLNQLPDSARGNAEFEGTDCIRALLQIGGDEVIECLLRIAAERQLRCGGRCAALGEIGRLRIREAIPMLIAIASEEETDRWHPVRSYAIDSLGALRAVEALDLLCELVARDRDRSAIIALGRISDPRAIPFLIPELESSSWYRDAKEALRRIGTPEALAAIAAHPSKWDFIPND